VGYFQTFSSRHFLHFATKKDGQWHWNFIDISI